MSQDSSLVPASCNALPIARMRALYRVGDVERRLDKLPAREHENLRATYERMLEKGPERFQVKPAGLPAMEHLYDELPNFGDVLDDVKRQLALCQDSRDALEITPMLLLGPPGIGKTHFAREVAQLLGTGMGFISMSSLTAGWVLSGASSQWKGARPGKVFETLVEGAYANPVMVVDEIDKARGEHAYDPLGALYSLLEHDTAGTFTDEFAEVSIDASQLIWVATANDDRAIPEPILNRMNVYEVHAPDRDAAREAGDHEAGAGEQCRPQRHQVVAPEGPQRLGDVAVPARQGPGVEQEPAVVQPIQQTVGDDPECRERQAEAQGAPRGVQCERDAQGWGEQERGLLGEVGQQQQCGPGVVGARSGAAVEREQRRHQQGDEQAVGARGVVPGVDHHVARCVDADRQRRGDRARRPAPQPLEQQTEGRERREDRDQA